jgi:hypothetical protein
MSIRLFFDEDSKNGAVVRALRVRQRDVLTSGEAGQDGRNDMEQLRYATSLGRVLVSSNIGDFQRLHTEYLQANDEHAGIILIHQKRFSIGEQARRLMSIMNFVTDQQMRNRMEFLSNW